MFDTTSFSVYGEYEGLDCKPAIEINLGHPKDGRGDLKQFVISMVTNQCGIPLFVQAHSGNKSNKKTLNLSTLSLDHLGIVVAIFDAFGISEVIDEFIPKARKCKLGHSAIIKAFIINELGFVKRRLYLFPSYFENLALLPNESGSCSSGATIRSGII